jgi:hybrid cluster-associated redox disulfide protein
MKAKTPKITKEMMLVEVVEKYPQLAEVLTEEYGFHCIGCFAAEEESLEQGAMVHGMTKREVTKLVETLNQLIETGKEKPRSNRKTNIR